MRIAYNLFTQNKGGEMGDFRRWTDMLPPLSGSSTFRHNGAGEMLVFSAADFEDFREPRPELPASMEGELEDVVRLLVDKRWPFRLHATYDESISRALDVFERVNRDTPFNGLHWWFDHAETISQPNIDRVAQLQGGIAVQHRMAYQGEAFVQRYGAHGQAGTDATRVASYNPWVSLSWLVTGKTVGGLQMTAERHLLDRHTALQLWTQANTWFSHDEGRKGQIAVGQWADFALLSADYFQVTDSDIAELQAELTVMGGRIVHGSGAFADLAPPLPPASPDWSPVRRFGGYQHRNPADGLFTRTGARAGLGCACASACGVHAHAHAWDRTAPADDARSFWGALGCSCWAF